jgi:hypothetical protein
VSGFELSRWREAGHAGYRDAAPDDPDARAALQPILRAGRLSRFRLLDIACSNGHRLAQVIRTPIGPVISGVGPITEVFVEEREDGVVAEGIFIPSSWGYETVGYDAQVGPLYIERDERQRTRRGNRQEQVCCRLDLIVPPTAGGAANSVTVSCRCRTRTIDPRWLVETPATRTRRAVLQ